MGHPPLATNTFHGATEALVGQTRQLIAFRRCRLVWAVSTSKRWIVLLGILVAVTFRTRPLTILPASRARAWAKVFVLAFSCCPVQ